MNLIKPIKRVDWEDIAADHGTPSLRDEYGFERFDQSDYVMVYNDIPSATMYIMHPFWIKVFVALWWVDRIWKCVRCSFLRRKSTFMHKDYISLLDVAKRFGLYNMPKLIHYKSEFKTELAKKVYEESTACMPYEAKIAHADNNVYIEPIKKP